MSAIVETGKTGEAPDFTPLNIKGDVVKLSDFKRKKHVVLVFNRGVFWQHCQKHMVQLRQDYQKFTERQAEIIAIGPEDRKDLAEY